MINISDYQYKYEMHLHTSEASACAKSTGAEMAKAHKDAGYTGIVVTNHAWGGNTCVDRSMPYEKWIDAYARGYYEAKEVGDKIGLQVFFGMEAGFNATEFLLYGLEPEDFKRYPELWNADIPEQYRIIHHAGGLVIHAHPYREEFYIPEIRLFPDYVDGVEIINATHSNHLSMSHNDPKFDTYAIEYAKKYGFVTTAGSDVHNTTVFGGGVILREKIESNMQLADVIRNNGDYILTNGDHYYDKRGDLLA